MNPKKFPYSTKFLPVVKSLENVSNVALASYDNLKYLLDGIDLENNIDLMGTVFDLCIANQLNDNDDGIDSKGAVAIRNFFLHKPSNKEHIRGRVVGHIVNVVFRDINTGEIIEPEVAETMTDPFLITCAGVVYKAVDESFAEVLYESSDPDSPLYQVVSASWELGFQDYDVVVGDKILSKASIISDETEKQKLSSYLRGNGGKGVDNQGRYIGRLIKGEMLPLGHAYTENPAARVKGVKAFASKETEEPIVEPIVSTKKINIINMEIKNEKDLVVFLSDGDESKASYDRVEKTKELIESRIRTACENHAAELNAKESAVSEANNKIGELEATVDELRGDFARANEKVQQLEAAAAQAQQLAQQEALASRKIVRVAKIKEIYASLTEDKIALAFAAQIDSLDDEAFNAWFDATKDILRVNNNEENNGVANNGAGLEATASNKNNLSLPFSRTELLESVASKPSWKINVVR